MKYNKGVVIATTGYSESQLKRIEALSEKVAVLKSGNMSIGVNLLLDLVEKAAKTLKDSFDIEIIEKHHNQKADAPSGTAMMLAEKVREVKTDAKFLYGRGGLSKSKFPRTYHSRRARRHNRGRARRYFCRNRRNSYLIAHCFIPQNIRNGHA